MEVTSMFAEWVYADCPAISLRHRDSALARQGELTKPAGALGRLETLAVELAALQHTDRPSADRVPITLVLKALDAHPLLDLDLRLGEGSGAALALPILRLACALHNRMATFAEAAVPVLQKKARDIPRPLRQRVSTAGTFIR